MSQPFGFSGCGTVANQTLSATWRIRSASSSAVIAGCGGTVRSGWRGSMPSRRKIAWKWISPRRWNSATLAYDSLTRTPCFLASLARKHGVRVKLSYAKVAEFQRRGLIHFHAIFRLDGIDPLHPERTVPPHPAITAELLADLIRQVADKVWFATISHPMKPTGWDITWGDQVDPRVVRLTGGG